MSGRELHIEWSHDEHECEACGVSYSIGAVVTLDGEMVIDKPASAYCWDSVSVSEYDILQALCSHLDIHVSEGSTDWGSTEQSRLQTT